MGPDARVISFSGQTETGSRLFSMMLHRKVLDIKTTRYIEPLEGIIYYTPIYLGGVARLGTRG